MEPIPIPLKALVPAIPTDDKELRELGEDLRTMGCDGLLAQPWDVQDADVLREFKFERGNQWLHTMRRDPERWNPDTWAEVYGFPIGVGKGLAGRKDGLCAGKFRGELDPKEGLHPANCRNARERRVLEFLMPILYPEKPKRISLTMANTLFGALSGVRPVNWGLLIHEVVGRAIPNIGRKPSYLSPFILHLYKHYECIKPEEEDKLNIAADEVTYKVRKPAQETSTSDDPTIPEVLPSSPGSPASQRPPASPPKSRRSLSPPPPEEAQEPPHTEAGTSRDPPRRNVDASDWEIRDLPFQVTHDNLTEMQVEYHRLEFVVRGASQALGGCRPGNIIREINRRADRRELEQAKKELEQARLENAHLQAQRASMAEELARKSEEIRKLQGEQAAVIDRVREYVGHPGELATKARLYDQLAASGEPVSARQVIPILVKYARMTSNLFTDIQKILPPAGTPRRVLYAGPPGSPTGTLYEEVGKVAIMTDPPTTAEPSEQAGGSRPGSSGQNPERPRSSGARRKSTGSARSGRGQSPGPRGSDRSRTPDRVRSPIRNQALGQEATPDKGKSRANPSAPTSPADYLMEEPAVTPPSRTASARDPRTASGRQHSHPAGSNPAASPSVRKGAGSGTPASRAPPAEETGDSEEEVAPSPNLRRAFTRLQSKASPGSSSLVGGLDMDGKEKSASKKPRSS